MKYRTVIHQITIYTDVTEDECQELYGCPLDELDARRVMEKDHKLNAKRLVERSDDANLTSWKVTDIQGTVFR